MLYYLLIGCCWLCCSSCTDPQQDIQETWAVKEIIYYEEEATFEPYGMLTLTFTEDSLYNCSVNRERISSECYELREQDDGASHRLVTTKGDSVYRATVRVYPDSLLIYPENGYCQYITLTPLRRFQQATQKKAVKALFNHQVYTSNIPIATTLGEDMQRLEFLEEGWLVIPARLELGHSRASYWYLSTHKGELFLSLLNRNRDPYTFQIASISEDSIQLWRHDHQAFFTLEKQALPTTVAPKTDYVGYWQEIENSSATAPVQVQITSDSLYVQLDTIRHIVPWQISPSGLYWCHKNIFSKHPYYNQVHSAPLLEGNRLQMQVVYYNKETKEQHVQPYFLERVEEAEFRGSLEG